MPFDWNGYLEIAKNFKTETDGQPESNIIEAKQRTAISRAYYFMFHLAEDYAKTHFVYVPKKFGPNQAHSDVRSEYQQRLGDPNHQEVAKILFRMQKARNDSDYESSNLGNVRSLLASVILSADKLNSTLR